MLLPLSSETWCRLPGLSANLSQYHGPKADCLQALASLHLVREREREGDMNYLSPLLFVPSFPFNGEGYMSRKQKVTNTCMVYRWALPD